MGKQLRVTAETIKNDWGYCCYSLDEIKRLFGRRKYVDAEFILRHPEIPAKDKIWCVLREEMIEEPILHEFALWCGERALLNQRWRGVEPHPASWNALRVKRRWLQGRVTDDELLEARVAAAAAARKAPDLAVWAAAEAADSAARAVPARAADSAARAAAGVVELVLGWARAPEGESAVGAAWERAAEAVYKRQCAKLLRMIAEAKK